MQYALVAAALGVLAGYATGGRLRNVGVHPVRAWPLIAVATLLQLPGRANATMLVFALACLLAFALANLHIVGVGVIAVGLALNAAVIAANGAMPVRASAAARVGLGPADLGGGRRLEQPGDRLIVLADVLPARPLRQVLSFGDLVVAAGTADVVARLMGRRRTRATGAARVKGRQPRSRLPRLWSKTPKPSPRQRSVPVVAGGVTHESSVVSSVAISAPSKPVGRAGASGGPQRA
jgi:hypothetical protein